MEESLKEKFISKLEEKYGSWNKIRSRFGTASFGVISRDLSISASQFSKLISGSATEGMYQRSIENIDRLIQQEDIREKLKKTIDQNQVFKSEISSLKLAISRRKYLIIGSSLLFLFMGSITTYLYVNGFSFSPAKDETTPHPLSAYFDLDFNSIFDSPYLDLSEVQDYCPCSAYEGIWSLSDSYKLPLPGSRKPGVYYGSLKADVRMKCNKFDTLHIGKGRVLMGYEYLINEIWVDTKMTPLSPLYFDKQSKTYTQAFEDLVFEENPQFQKVATIHSFFIDRFEIYDDSIVRKGEPSGRYASDINEDLAQQFEIDVKYILEDVVGDLTTTHCTATVNPFCDPNTLTEKESEMVFDCLYTIKSENLGIGGGYPYRKGYQLEKQIYADNLTCGCEP